MAVTIHPTAIVDPKASIADGVSVGPFSIIEADTIIGEGTRIMQNAYIASGARIGKECVIHHSAVISNVPQDLKFKESEKTYVEVGDRTTIREFATLHRATIHTSKGNSGTKDGVTRVGSDCLIMAYAHIAHDCLIGDKVIIANAIGGSTAIHQFSQIGKHVMIGGGQLLIKDVPPYALVGGQPSSFSGVNRVGLMRRGFSDAAIIMIRKAYTLLYNSGLNFSDAIREIQSTPDMDTPEVNEIIRFYQNSDRGVISR
jgi:UDP-N-acetylglucosamine acyltransferase